MENAADISRLVAQGKALFDDDKFKQAVKVYGQALAKNPRCVDALFGRGVCRWAMDEYDEAIEDLSAALKIDPDHVNARNFRGECYLAKFDIGRSRKDFLDVVKKNVAHGRAYDNLAITCEVRGDWRGAIEWHSKAIVYGEATCQRFRQRGACFSTIGEYSNAFRDFSDALSIDPDDVESLRSRAQICGFFEVDGKETDELHQMQLDDLTRILRLHPNDEDTLEDYIYATVFITPRFEDALAACKRLEQVDKKLLHGCGFLLVCRGEARFKTGDVSGALRDFAAAIRIGEYPSFAYLQRAKLYLHCNEWKKCISDASKSIDADARDWAGHVLRSQAKSKLGRHTEALQDLTHVIDLFPDDPKVVEWLKMRADIFDELNEPAKAEADRKHAASFAATVNRATPD